MDNYNLDFSTCHVCVLELVVVAKEPVCYTALLPTTCCLLYGTPAYYLLFAVWHSCLLLAVCCTALLPTTWKPVRRYKQTRKDGGPRRAHEAPLQAVDTMSRWRRQGISCSSNHHAPPCPNPLSYDNISFIA